MTLLEIETAITERREELVKTGQLMLVMGPDGKGRMIGSATQEQPAIEYNTLTAMLAAMY